MFTGVQKAKAGDEQKLAGALSRLYKTVLEMITTEIPSSQVLECLCTFMEEQFPELLCSILLLDSDGVTLRHGAAPRLPQEYSRLIDGGRIGPRVGSCGTAAFLRKPVIVTDIATDPLWKDISHGALAHGLQACWSTPILSRAGKVLGTFAVYYREPRGPDADHWQIVECATHLAGMAIERERAEAELRAVETRYRALVEQLPAITYIAEVGVLGRWLYVSPQIQSILGFSAEEWMTDAANWANHLHPEDRDGALEAETHFWEAGGMYRAEYRMIARDGRVLWFRDDAVYLQTADARKPVMQGVLYDITEHKRLEDQLRQSQKIEAVGQLAGGAAHDFNNLLMIMQGHNERILQRVSPDDPLRKDAAEIKEAISRAASLTRRLLAFSRKQVLQPKVLDMNLVVSEVSKMLDRLIEENVEVSLVTAPALWRVKVDQGQMEQAILNLTLNARDAMPHGGKLVIETNNAEVDAAHASEHGSVKPGRYVMLSVSDTGVGMDTETQSHIFEPFFTTKELGKGTGLGLASVYGIVQQSGGRIFFRSQLGHGTTFSIYLPVASQAGTAPEDRLGPATQTKGSETVLVVEDEHQIRDLVSEYLQRNGYTVLHANNGRDALEVALRYKGLIHLLISDVVMPEIGGHELARHLQRLRPRIKVLFTSGYPEHTALNDRFADPQATILQKPFPLHILANKIRELLDAPDFPVAQSLPAAGPIPERK